MLLLGEISCFFSAQEFLNFSRTSIFDTLTRSILTSMYEHAYIFLAVNYFYLLHGTLETGLI